MGTRLPEFRAQLYLLLDEQVWKSLGHFLIWLATNMSTKLVHVMHLKFTEDTFPSYDRIHTVQIPNNGLTQWTTMCKGLSFLTFISLEWEQLYLEVNLTLFLL